MITLDDYCDRYETIAFERDDRGVLEMTFHSEGDSLRWGALPHREMSDAFRFVAKDRGNRIVLMRGTGHEFCGPRVSDAPRFTSPPDGTVWEEQAYSEANELIGGLLDIAVPIVSVINGPVLRHSELPLLGDIVIASDDASFEDSAHFSGGNLVPGDGVHVVYEALLGFNRARHFLLTGRVIHAAEALALGLVAEVVPKAEVLERGRFHARSLAAKPDRLLRYTRSLLNQPMKRRMLDYLPLGLAVEGCGVLA